MKVALVHDYLKEYGGAERVLEALHEIYPNAELFTLIYCPEYLGPHKTRFDGWKIKTSLMQYIPFKEKLVSPFRLISSKIFKSFDFSKYDLVIVSATGAYFPNSIQKVRAKHVCYCHTPPRYLYGYKTARDWDKNSMVKIIVSIINHFLRLVDYKTAQNVDFFIANSQEVKKRIEKFYRRKAVVINPPVDIKKVNYEGGIRKGNYFLAGGRLARAKRIDLAIKACKKLDLPLKVFGKSFAGYTKELNDVAGNKTEFLGEVSEEEKCELMRGAIAYIFPSDSEDFGITPVEAMSVGTPVIAYGSGGVLETVIDNKTGLFFNDLKVESLIEAIEKFKKVKWNRELIMKSTEKYSKERFIKEFRKFINKEVIKN